jgi:hypothetical protein
VDGRAFLEKQNRRDDVERNPKLGEQNLIVTTITGKISTRPTLSWLIKRGMFYFEKIKK